MDDIERIMRKWPLEEASGYNGPEVTQTPGPSSVQRWPLGTIDSAYWEVSDCD